MVQSAVKTLFIHRNVNFGLAMFVIVLQLTQFIGEVVMPVFTAILGKILNFNGVANLSSLDFEIDLIFSIIGNMF